MRRMVEGRARSAFFHDLRHYPVEMIPDIRGQESQRPHPALVEPPIALRVADWIVAHVMTGAVHLDRQRRRVTEEVERIGLGGMLPAKFEPARTCP